MIHNVRLYDDAEQVWKMMWIATSTRQVHDLRAEMRDGKLTMWQIYPERPGFLADFTIINDDQWDRVLYVLTDEGTWAPQFKLSATRIACD